MIMSPFRAATVIIVSMLPPTARANRIFQKDILLNTNTLYRTSTTSKARIAPDELDFYPSMNDDNHDNGNHDMATLIPQNRDTFGRADNENVHMRSDALQLSCSLPAPPPSSIEISTTDRTFRSTGTTICGCLVGSYVILGADTRATDDRMVADKNCEKIHKLARNMYACGAGTSADLDMITRQVEYRLRLQVCHAQSIGNDPTATTINNVVPSVPGACRMLRDILFEGGGNVGANLIVGGHEHGKATLLAIHPHGSMDVVPFSALGSGGLAAMAVLELGYSQDLTLEEGKELVKRAITAGIQNDLGSGSQVDLLVLGPDDFVDYQRGVIPEEQGEGRRQVDIMSDGQGVNGFGNSPYEVKSRRVLKSVDESRETQAWNELLGL